MNVQTKTEFSTAIAIQFRRLGAVHVDIGADGIATHWRTDQEACTAAAKFNEMGLSDVEKFSDNGLVAVFARFPK